MSRTCTSLSKMRMFAILGTFTFPLFLECHPMGWNRKEREEKEKQLLLVLLLLCACTCQLFLGYGSDFMFLSPFLSITHPTYYLGMEVRYPHF